MARFSGRQVWLSILVMVMVSPVVLGSGSASFRPPWYLDRAAGVPISVWMVVGLIAIYVALVAAFAAAGFGATAPEKGDGA